MADRQPRRQAPRSDSSAAGRSAVPSRVPPHNLAAEESLIGAMLLSRDAIAAAVESVSADDFYKPAHAHIFEAITTLYGAGEPADPVTVAEELRRAGLLEAMGGPELLVELQASTPSIGNAARYGTIVEENALLRRLIKVAGEVAEIGYEMPDDVTKAVDRAESMIFEVAQRRVTDSTVALRDLLGDALDRLEKLFERGESITGLPTGYTDLDDLLSGLQPSNLVVVGARPSMGKCVAADTLLVDPATGLRHSARELHERGRAGEFVQVPALGSDARVWVAEPSQFVDDGVKPVFEVRTASGRRVRTTLSHPFLTPRGWCALAGISVGTPIAVPRRLEFFGAGRMAGSEIVLLAHLTAGGRQALADLVDRGRELDVDVVGLARRHGLHELDAARTAVPDEVFGLRRDLVARYIDRLLDALRPCWTDDFEHSAYVVPSPQLVRDLQHLLIRFSVDATIEWSASAPVLRLATEARRQLMTEAGVGAHVGARVAWRSHAGASPGEPGQPSDDGTDVSWDEVVAIEFVGDQQVYDLSVPELHNFVADDVFVHNTAFALGMASNIAVREERPVLFFSLEMGHRELTQRILSAEARVDSSRMRKGDLREEDWSKLMKAIGTVEQAQLWIDDNPNVSVMEIRAKARRMKSRLGDLGLIVVDYLQLMTGRSSAENRQVEVAEISRNLKILARELEVPVVALSQLSRALELRADKRPMLADLRESGCLPASARVMRADNGHEVTIGELVRSQQTPQVWSVDAHHRLVPARVVNAFATGIKPVFRLVLASGRAVEATANHPFLTVDGWSRLDALSVGSCVGVPRRVPAPILTTAALDDDEIVSLAHRTSRTRAGTTAIAEMPARASLDATGDVAWDEVVAIQPVGELPTFDLTIEGTHNFIADGVIVHNSIEQDADVVMFIYRDEVYNSDSPDKGVAEVIVAKHRNGPTGTKRLAFIGNYTRFANMARGA